MTSTDNTAQIDPNAVEKIFLSMERLSVGSSKVILALMPTSRLGRTASRRAGLSGCFHLEGAATSYQLDGASSHPRRAKLL